jgi:hypothetical protein
MKPDAYIWQPHTNDMRHVSLWPSTSGYFRSIPLIDPARITEAHVICCNDMLLAIVIGDEGRAKDELEQLREIDYERNKFKFSSEEEYLSRLYWHIHTVRAVCDVSE